MAHYFGPRLHPSRAYKRHRPKEFREYSLGSSIGLHQSCGPYWVHMPYTIIRFVLQICISFQAIVISVFVPYFRLISFHVIPTSNGNPPIQGTYTPVTLHTPRSWEVLRVGR